MKLYINGKLVDGQGSKMDVKNPATGEIIETLNCASAQQANEALEAANKAFRTWSKVSLNERRIWIRKIMAAIEEERERILEVEVQESGKTWEQAEDDLNVLLMSFEYYIEEVRRITGETIQDENCGIQTYHMCERRPLGVVVDHLAWNFPMLNLGYKLCPAISSGCTCVIKPSSKTPLATLLLGEILEKAELPAGVVNFVAGPSAEVSKVLNESKIPRMIGCIGSANTGISLMRQASTSMKRFSLELGGNSPAMVLKDANIPSAAGYIAFLKRFNGGQVCTDINRAFVHADVLDSFVEEVKKVWSGTVYGSGHTEGANMGPMITKEAQQRMADLVADAVAKGAKVEFGGGIPKSADSNGNFFEPTMLTGVTEDMRVYQEEIFGPILPIITFTDLDKALEMANDTELGLCAYIYTQDMASAFKSCEVIQSGTAYVNVSPGGDIGMMYPHTGLKGSGMGVDRSKYSVEEYYQLRQFTVTPQAFC